MTGLNRLILNCEFQEIHILGRRGITRRRSSTEGMIHVSHFVPYALQSSPFIHNMQNVFRLQSPSQTGSATPSASSEVSRPRPIHLNPSTVPSLPPPSTDPDRAGEKGDEKEVGRAKGKGKGKGKAKAMERPDEGGGEEVLKGGKRVNWETDMSLRGVSASYVLVEWQAKDDNWHLWKGNAAEKKTVMAKRATSFLVSQGCAERHPKGVANKVSCTLSRAASQLC